MFGYIVVNEQELKVRELRKYRSYYCGLCRALRQDYGIKGQITLSYDMTFVVMLLSALYEPEMTESMIRCVPHPVEKHHALVSQFSHYAADMNILLTYYKSLDDWYDEKKMMRYVYARSLYPAVKRIRKKYPEKAVLIADRLKKIRACEKRKEKNLDIPSGLFGEIMAQICVRWQDEWKDDLYQLGFYLGKFIYLMDAYDDREKDLKTGNYNVFLLREKEAGSGMDDVVTEKNIRSILMMMMSECARAYERLPILQDADILRNILYSGIWAHYHGERKETGNGHESL